MKYVLLVGDGMSDYPLPDLDNKTPLEAARTPFMDQMARTGQTGLAKTIPDGYAPGSDIGNLSLLGYDPVRYFSGRAPLEAVNLGVNLSAHEVAFRCNLVTVSDNVMEDFAAGHISTGEAAEIMATLNADLGDMLTFHTGTSYRHVAVISANTIGNDVLKQLDSVKCTPPHDIIGERITDHLPDGGGADLLMDVMDRAAQLLADHPVTVSRRAARRHPATGIWLWGQGRIPNMPSFREKHGLSGAVISAVDLIKGMGKCAGLDTIIVPGATGYFDTNYIGKAEHALEALDDHDFVWVHVESPDEAGHEGLIDEKIRSIEKFDELVVGTVWKELRNRGDFRILTTCDHATPLKVRTHTRDMVPFAFAGTGTESNGAHGFSEAKAAATGRVLEKGYRLMKAFIKGSVDI